MRRIWISGAVAVAILSTPLLAQAAPGEAPPPPLPISPQTPITPTPEQKALSAALRARFADLAEHMSDIHPGQADGKPCLADADRPLCLLRLAANAHYASGTAYDLEFVDHPGLLIAIGLTPSEIATRETAGDLTGEHSHPKHDILVLERHGAVPRNLVADVRALRSPDADTLRGLLREAGVAGVDPQPSSSTGVSVLDLLTQHEIYAELLSLPSPLAPKARPIRAATARAFLAAWEDDAIAIHGLLSSDLAPTGPSGSQRGMLDLVGQRVWLDSVVLAEAYIAAGDLNAARRILAAASAPDLPTQDRQVRQIQADLILRDRRALEADAAAIVDRLPSLNYQDRLVTSGQVEDLFRNAAGQKRRTDLVIAGSDAIIAAAARTPATASAAQDLVSSMKAIIASSESPYLSVAVPLPLLAISPAGSSVAKPNAAIESMNAPADHLQAAKAALIRGDRAGAVRELRATAALGGQGPELAGETAWSVAVLAAEADDRPIVRAMLDLLRDLPSQPQSADALVAIAKAELRAQGRL